MYNQPMKEEHLLLAQFKNLKLVLSFRSQLADVPMCNARVTLEKSISEFLGVEYDPAIAVEQLRHAEELTNLIKCKQDELDKLRVLTETASEDLLSLQQCIDAELESAKRHSIPISVLGDASVSCRSQLSQ